LPYLSLCVFEADATPPLGSPLCGGLVKPAAAVDDPQSARGLVFLAGDLPLVLVAIDWCELRNDAHDLWREALADAAGTTSERVIVTTVHQHDAPIVDIAAQALFDRHGIEPPICDVGWHRAVVDDVSEALHESLARPTPIDEIGVGGGQVERFASNRRPLGHDGKVIKPRLSAMPGEDPVVALPEGLVDPWLRSLSFHSNGRPVAVVSCYATHPMSHYGDGQVSADTVGLARRRREAELHGAVQVYLSGCGGNLAAGKYNDGSPEMRSVLADRLAAGMRAAWRTEVRYPVTAPSFTSVPIDVSAVAGVREAEAEFGAVLDDPGADHYARWRAASGLAFVRRVASGRALDIPAVDFGPAVLAALPGEPFVEYQLAAQAFRRDKAVIVAGYGDCGLGYLCTDVSHAEGGYEPTATFLQPGAEPVVMEALRAAVA